MHFIWMSFPAAGGKVKTEFIKEQRLCFEGKRAWKETFAKGMNYFLHEHTSHAWGPACETKWCGNNRENISWGSAGMGIFGPLVCSHRLARRRFPKGNTKMLWECFGVFFVPPVGFKSSEGSFAARCNYPMQQGTQDGGCQNRGNLFSRQTFPNPSSPAERDAFPWGFAGAPGAGCAQVSPAKLQEHKRGTEMILFHLAARF